MAKKSKKFDEATMTTAIKGYLAGRRVLDPYASKREKKPDAPWYLKKSNDLEDMVRKHLGEQRFDVEFSLLMEAKFPGLEFGDLPPDLQQGILKLAKSPGKVNPSWRRWEALPPELQKKIEEFYLEKKSKWPEKKKSSIRMPYIKPSKVSGGPRAKDLEKGGSKYKPQGRDLPSKEEHISDLRSLAKKLEDKIRLDPQNMKLRIDLKSIKKQIDKVLGLGDDWRDQLAYGKKPEKKVVHGPAKYIEADPELQSQILKIIPKERQNRPSRGDVGPVQNTPLEHAIYKLQKVAGLIPTTPDEHAKLSNWAQKVIIGKYNGSLLDYYKGRRAALDQKEQEILAKLKLKPQNSALRSKLKSIKSQKTQMKPGRAFGIEPQHMKIKTGHKAAPPAIRTTKRARDPLYGSEKTLRGLHRKAEKTPFHQQSKFARPSSGKGKISFPGSVGKILSKIYGKMASEWLYGGDDGPASFDEVLRSVNRRHPGVDLEDALRRYTELAQKWPGEDRGLDDAPDAFVDSLRGKISPEEMKALMELSTLTDQDTIAAIRTDNFTAFERAMGPFLRKIYAKGVETQAHPGMKAQYDSPDSPEDVEGSVAFSPVMKQELVRFIPLILKGTPVSLDNVEEKAAEIKQSNPDVWKKIENSVLLALKKRDPRLFSQELKMKKKRERAEEDESKIAYMRQKKDVARRRQADLDLTRKQLISREKSRQARDEFGVETPASALKKDTEFKKGSAALKKAAGRKHLVPRGGGDLSKSQKRELGRMEEPRDPEELARRKAMEPQFKGNVPAGKPRPKSPRKVSSFRGPKEFEKKKDRLDLIKKSVAKHMASNESKEFSISELFEGFENSWDLDVPTKEEEWESAKLASKKDWTKDLTLESLVASLEKKK